jgi:lipopolysaccharide export system protein LptC
MNATKQAVWLFFTLIALASLGWHFANTIPVIKLDEQTLAKTADSVILDLSIKQFDKKGELINFLESPQMEHIPDQEKHIFTAPHIILTQEDNSNWDIRSHDATAIHKGERIIFKKNVVITQQKKDTPNTPSIFKTEELTYIVKQKFAFTPLAVTFIQPGTVVQSTGMNAYLADQHIVLLNKTHAVYNPHPA